MQSSSRWLMTWMSLVRYPGFALRLTCYYEARHRHPILEPEYLLLRPNNLFPLIHHENGETV